MQKNIEFYSEGSLIKGVLYLPEKFNESEQYPAIVLCHGFAGVKELLLPGFAKRFSEKGYIALTFDYRGFGESEGEVGRIVPSNQITDIRNAISFIQSLEYFQSNNIALWGTSYGGANAMIATALDKRVKCLTVQLTFGDGERVVTNGLSEEEKVRMFESINKIWIKKVTKNKELFIPINKALSDEQTSEFFDKNVNDFPAMKIKIPFLTVKETMSHKPELYLNNIKVPILIISAENDKVNPKEESKIIFDKANEPKELYVIKNATHYEVYEGEKFEEVVNKQIEWFDIYLK